MNALTFLLISLLLFCQVFDVSNAPNTPINSGKEQPVQQQEEDVDRQVNIAEVAETSSQSEHVEKEKELSENFGSNAKSAEETDQRMEKFLEFDKVDAEAHEEKQDMEVHEEIDEISHTIEEDQQQPKGDRSHKEFEDAIASSAMFVQSYAVKLNLQKEASALIKELKNSRNAELLPKLVDFIWKLKESVDTGEIECQIKGEKEQQLQEQESP